MIDNSQYNSLAKSSEKEEEKEIAEFSDQNITESQRLFNEYLKDHDPKYSLSFCNMPVSNQQSPESSKKTFRAPSMEDAFMIQQYEVSD